MASKFMEKEKNGEPVPKKRTRATGPSEDDGYFMAVALLFAKKSPDPRTKVGACIVDEEGNIVGVGYNKMPSGCEDEFQKRQLWNHESADRLKTKYPYVCHAELNAIMNKTSVDVKGCTIYVTLFPCNECAKAIIQSGIRDVVYLSNKYADSDESKACLTMLDTAGIPHRQFETKEELAALLKSIDPFAE